MFFFSISGSKSTLAPHLFAWRHPHAERNSPGRIDPPPRNTCSHTDVTYIASILMKSTDYKYLVTNASWIAGSAFTIFLDLFIIGQFAYYSYQDRDKTRVFADDAVDEE